MNTRIIACCTAAIFTGTLLFAQMPCPQRNEQEARKMKPQTECIFCLEAEELFPEDAAKTAQLRETAMESQRALMEKVMQKRKAEMKTLRKLVKAYRESPTGENLAELKKWVSEKIEAKTASVQKQLNKAKAELESIEKLGLSPRRMEQIRRLYEVDCKRAEMFLNQDKTELAEKIVRRLTSAEQKHSAKHQEMGPGRSARPERPQGKEPGPERCPRQDSNPFED